MFPWCGYLNRDVSFLWDCGILITKGFENEGRNDATAPYSWWKGREAVATSPVLLQVLHVFCWHSCAAVRTWWASVWALEIFYLASLERQIYGVGPLIGFCLEPAVREHLTVFFWEFWNYHCTEINGAFSCCRSQEATVKAVQLILVFGHLMAYLKTRIKAKVLEIEDLKPKLHRIKLVWTHEYCVRLMCFSTLFFICSGDGGFYYMTYTEVCHGALLNSFPDRSPSG